MIFSNDTFYISYFDELNDDLKFAKSTNGGIDWFITTVDVDAGDYNDIIVDGENVLISYYDWLNSDLKIAKSINGGATWPSEDIISPDSSGSLPEISVDGNTLYITYIKNDVTFIISLDGGNTFAEANNRIIDGDVI